MSKARADLSAIRKLADQGPDPVSEQEIHRSFWRKFGFEVNVLPGPLHSLVKFIFTPLLEDPSRDTYYGEIITKWLLYMVPMWLYLLFVCDQAEHPYRFALLVAVYLATWVDQLEVYILSLHCLVHRRAFKIGQQAVKVLYMWGFGPMFGVTPETYQSHHIGMHHVRNNGLRDASSTMPYRRDSVYDFLRYLLNFHFAHKKVADSLLDLGNAKAVKKFVIGEVSWLVCGLIIAFFRPIPAVVVWFFPMVMIRTGMCLGNFGQHAFINDADPHNDYNLSAVIIDSEYNTKAFNDGYHIMHHLYPSAHYMDLPKLFVTDLPTMAEHDSVVFTAKRQTSPLIDWPSITFLLLQHKYDVLADHFVDCRAIVNKTKPRSKEEIIALLKSRTCKVYTKD
jgi:fatty acid desaturase